MTALQAALQAAGAAVYDHEGVLIMGTADRLMGTADRLMGTADRRQPHRHQTAAAA